MTDEFGVDVPNFHPGIAYLTDANPDLSPAGMLASAAQTFKQRAEVYGDNYKRFGIVIDALFPDGIKIDVEEQYNRYGLLVQIVSKLTRYCENFNKGGHDDSLNDLAVYAAMLRSLDKEINEVPF